MKNTSAELTRSHVVEPVSIVPSRCGAGTGGVDSVEAAAADSVSVDNVLAVSAEAGSAAGVSCPIVIVEVPNKINVARTV